MNIWKAIAVQLEKQTGFTVRALEDINDTIETHELILLIENVALTEMPDIYEVHGQVAIKYAQQAQWQVLTNLLDMQLTGFSRQAFLTNYNNGFSAMALEFSILVHKDPQRQFIIKEVKYEIPESSH